MIENPLSLYAGIFLVHLCVGIIGGEFGNQPKLYNHDGQLTLEPAWDKNLTFRLMHDADLYFGEMNVMDEVRQLLLIRSKSGGGKGSTTSGNGGAMLSPATAIAEKLPTSEALTNQVKNMKRDLIRLSRRLTMAHNRTIGPAQQRRMRRFMGRMRSVEIRLSQLEVNLALNECNQIKGNPCKNGGNCYKGYKSFHCECASGWTGKTCEEDVDECYILTGTDLGCQNNGVCVNTNGGYRCVCTKGFTGTHCRIRNATCESAQSTEICGHGICIHAADKKIGYTCLCDQGWAKNNVTTACVIDVDECASPTNPCHSGCINLPGTFRCEPCPSGYQGNGITCTDINECDHNNGGCSLIPKVQCINTEGSYHCGNCPVGYTGDGRNCVKKPSNTCESSNVCHERARCEFISDTVICTCPLGWYGHGFGPNGCSMEGNATDLCANHECKNNGTCTIMGRGTMCICQPGYMGAQCEQADACQVPDACQNGGSCKLLPGNTYSCTCQRGTTGKRCEIVREVCGTALRRESGELSYPEAGVDHYEPFERCAWMIRTADTKVLNVTFTKFDLEEADTPDGECRKDWLQIHDGRSLTAPLIGRFCGKHLPLDGTSIQSSHQQLIFWFRSDNTTHGGGFTLTWTSQEHTCGQTAALNEGDTGIIRSPGYPGKTAPNRNCEWKLTAPYGFRFILRIYEVILGSGNGDSKALNGNCSRDALKIYDSDLLLRSICESMQPEPLHTYSNKALIYFHTDSYLADSAFQLHYEVVPGVPHCGGLFTESEGIIVGYINAPVCEYLIQQPPGTKISLEFLTINLFNSPDCNVQKIEIFDFENDEEEATLLKRVCGKENLREPLISRTNSMLLRYEYLIVGMPVKKEFKIKYKRVCGDRYFGPEGGIITTPNYPNPYFDHITCVYEIYGLSGTVVHVNFTDFSISETIPSPMEGTPSSRIENGTDHVATNYDNFVEVHLSDDVKRTYFKGAPLHLVSIKNRMRIIFHAQVNTRKARGLRIEYNFETIGCGGVLAEHESSFSKFGSFSNMPKFCEWIIEAPAGKTIYLDLQYERVGGPKCQSSEANLHIYANGTQGEKQLLGSFCGNDDTMREPIHSSFVSIILEKPLNAPHYAEFSFFGNYNLTDSYEDCGSTFLSQYGVVTSPGWPRQYPAQLNCEWHIEAPAGHQIELVVQNFTIEFDESCTSDYLEIRNGANAGSPLIGRYCGDTIPQRIPSFTNHLFLHFHTDSFLEYEGFFITWQQTRIGCGGKLTAYAGSIHPPLTSENDDDDLAVTCDWHIVVSEGSVIQLKLTQLGTAFDICDEQEMLIVYDGMDSMDNLIKWTQCNKSNNHNQPNNQQSVLTVRSTQNRMFIRYRNPIAYKEFALEYETICENQLLIGVHGIIESPNFPEPYPPSISCSWDIRAGKNNHISLVFSHLQLEKHSPDCEYDYVKVLDMRDDALLSEKHLCAQPLEPLTTEGNRVLLKFTSDYSQSDRGFRVEYKRLGCGELFQTNYRTFSSPQAPYSVDIDCDWYIEVAAGKQITLFFTDIHIETDRLDCADDALIVAESPGANSTELLRECSVERTNMIITSPANQLYIHFHTSSKRKRKYFYANYVAREASCGGMFHSPSGTITSPNYPDFARNIECVWHIKIDDTFGLLLEFNEIEITDSENCSEASYDVRNNAKIIAERSCGKQVAKKIHVENANEVIVTLRVSGGGAAKIAFKYQKECGGELTAPTGFLVALPNQRCFWKIMPPDGMEGALVSLHILHLDCPCAQNATQCRLKVLYDAVESTSVTTSLCSPLITNFMSETIYVQALSINFRAKYSTREITCGGKITSITGILSLPLHRGVYSSEMECVWEIRASAGNIIELNFLSMDIVSSPLCNEDFLEIRETDPNGKLFGVYCGKVAPTDPLTLKQSVWLKFKSAANSIGGEGFQLSWTYANAVEFNVSKGTIESPPVGGARLLNAAFTWRINAPRKSLIDIKLESYSRGLKFYDGFDDSALEVKAQYSPWNFISSSNVIYIMTKNSDLEYFELTWTWTTSEAVAVNATIKECHETVILPLNGRVNISSPGYPLSYKNNLDCEWIIKTEDPMLHAVLNLFDVKLEETQSCTADYLRVSTSSDLNNWHQRLQECTTPSAMSHVVPKFIVHGEPYLKMNFHSDMTIMGSGFTSLIFPACGSNMTASVGYISGSTLWRVRSMNSTCLWHIQVKPGKRIRFQFDYGKMELRKANENCWQYALIYDGYDTSAPILPPGQICNHPARNIKTVETSSNFAVLKYNISWHMGQGEKQLWNLTYREFSECDDEIVLTHWSTWSNISTPHYPNIPNPHTECNWVIIAPPGEAVRADFIGRVDLNPRFCNKEFVEFHDGATTMARSLDKNCGRRGTIRTTGNIMHIRYLADVDEPHNGFQLNVSLAFCGGSTHAAIGVITSPRYPALGAYARGSVCEWAIVLPKNVRVRLNFTDIHLLYNKKNEASSDRLEVLSLNSGNDEPELLDVFYGNLTLIPTMEVDGDSVIIRLRARALDNSKYRGFKLKYTRVYSSCNRNFVQDSGRIFLKRSQLSFGFSLFCNWRITVPHGQRVTLEITNLELQANNNTVQALRQQQRFNSNLPNLRFFHDFNMRAKITEFSVNEFNASCSVQSSGNVMVVRIQMSAGGEAINKIVATYNADEISPCPADIATESQTGQIVMPPVELAAQDFFCSANFELSGDETIVFEVDDLQLEQLNPNIKLHAVRISAELVESFAVLYKNVTATLNNKVLISFSLKRGAISWLQALPDTRIKHFSAKYFRYACGGYLNIDDIVQIDYPNLAVLGSTTLVECAWTLQPGFIRNAGTFKLKGNVSFVDDCDREYVMIYAGINTEKTLLAKICRSNPTLNATQLQRGFTYLLYHTEEYKPRQSNFQFRIERTIKCGSKWDVRTFTEKISVNSTMYKNNFECEWEFETNTALTLSLNFHDRFFIQDSANCSKDYLAVMVSKDGLWEPLARFCGREVPRIYNASVNHVMVIFHANDDNVNGDGFTFSVTAHCNAVLNVTEQTQIQHLPNLGQLHRASIHCTLELQTNSDKMINVRIRNHNSKDYDEGGDVSVDGSRKRIGEGNCDWARFTVRRREAIGLGAPSELAKNTNERYCRNADLRALNFIKLEYTALIDYGYYVEYDLNVCGGNITTPRTIRTVQTMANNEDTYIDGMNCVWYVQAPPDHSVVVRFKYFDMQEHSNCRFDYFAVYTGTTLSADKMVTKICGNLMKKPPVIAIDSNQAVLTAISNMSGSKRGFFAQVAFVPNCNERISLSDGNSPVTLTRQYKFNASEEMLCYYRFIAPEGYRISIQLHELELNTVTCAHQREDCSGCNYIELFDSLGAKRASMGKFCTNGRTNINLLSSYEDALIKLVGTIPGEYSFEIVLKMKPTACGVNKFELKGNEVVTLSFPTAEQGQQLYPPNTHCTWRIDANDEFNVRFSSLLLQNVSQVTNECIDYVHLKGNYVSSRFCGNATGYELTFPKNAKTFVEITFHSDETIESKGFTLTAQHRFVCNRTYTSLSNVLYYTSYGSYQDPCIDEIRVPDNFAITIYPLSVFMTGLELTLLQMTDIKTNETLQEFNQTTYVLKSVYTKTNAVRVTVRSYTVVRLFYYVAPKTAPPGCGGQIVSMEGEFSSPPYNDRNHSECRWEITVPSPNFIHMNFYPFDMGSITNCHLDNVKIFELLADGSQRLAKTLCGPELTDNFFDFKSNRAIVVAKKSPNFDGTGFAVSFRVVNQFDDWSPSQFVNVFP